MLKRALDNDFAGGVCPKRTKGGLAKAFTILALSCFAGTGVASAQEAAKDSATVWKKVQEPKAVSVGGKKIEITQSIQLWDVHTFESLGEQASESRNDMYIRRGRLGVKGTIVQDLDFNVAFAYDGIGRDKRTAGNGSPNPDDNHDFW